MHKTMRSLFTLIFVMASSFLVACGSSAPTVKPFKMEIQQGNVVTSKMLLQLRPGMTKSQVRFIMGTPLINDSFHTNRWDYFYQLRQAGKVVEQRRVILDFEKELLARVRGDVVPQGTPGADTGVTLANEQSAAAKPVTKEGLLENLKFWKSNQEEVTPAPKAEVAKPAVKEKSMLDKLKFWQKDTAATDAKAAPVIAAPEVAEKAVDAAIPAAPSTESEAPSMLAVPIVVAPIEPVLSPAVPATSPQAESSEKAEPVVAVPSQAQPEPVVTEKAATEKVMAEKSTATESPLPVPAPINGPESVNREEPFIFRLDRKLNTKNLQNAPAAPAEPSAKVKVEEEKILPAEDPGYFERMLEKIGF